MSALRSWATLAIVLLRIGSLASSSPLSNCSFEGSLCNWGVTDWKSVTPVKDGEPTGGPAIDHTFKNEWGTYLLADPTGSPKVTPPFELKASTSYCLTFWYHLFGPVPGTINVRLDYSGGSTDPLIMLNLTGDTDDFWKKATVELDPQTVSFIPAITAEPNGAKDYSSVAIDDVAVFMGACAPEPGPDCSFEAGMCGWSNSQEKSSAEFTLTRQTSGGQSSGPDVDHSMGTASGHSLVLAFPPSSPNETITAGVQNDTLKTDSPVCFGFYLATGGSLTSLSVRVDLKGPQDKYPYTVWSKEQPQGNLQWTKQEATILEPKDKMVFLMVTVIPDGSGYVALDDFEFLPGECASFGLTDFEKGIGAFTNDPSAELNWFTASASDKPGDFWLPERDMTFNDSLGHWGVAWSPYQDSQTRTGQLWSPVVPANDYNYRCLQFSYFRHGQGTLAVLLYTTSQSSISVWKDSTSAEGVFQGEVRVEYSEDFQVVFKADVTDRTGTLGLDEVRLTPNPECKTRPASAGDHTLPTAASTLSTKGPSGKSQYDCDFTNGTCEWRNVTGVKNAKPWMWVYKDNQTDFLLGLDRNNNYGHFLRLPRSVGLGEIAAIESPVIPSTAPYSCIKFWALNFRNDPIPFGNLSVIIESGGQQFPVFQLDKPNRYWTRFYVKINTTSSYKVLVQAQHARYHSSIGPPRPSFDGEIQFDGIEFLTSRDCPSNTIYNCSFEDPDICGFQQSSKSDVPWEWVDVMTHMEIVPPRSGARKPNYVMLLETETGERNVSGQLAILESPEVEPMTGCISVWIRLRDATARVYIHRQGDLDPTLLKEQEGTKEKRNIWEKHSMDITSKSPFSVHIVGEKASSVYAYVVVDNFAITQEACEDTWSCSFEWDLCGWRYIRGYTRFMRVRAGTWDTGPKVDTTLGDNYGHYMFFEALSFKRKYPGAMVQTSVLYPGNSTLCVHFSYWVQRLNDSVGPPWLQVVIMLVKYRGELPSYRFHPVDDMKWHRSQVDVTYKDPFRVGIGLVSFEWIGRGAFDDFYIREGNCEYGELVTEPTRKPAVKQNEPPNSKPKRSPSSKQAAKPGSEPNALKAKAQPIFAAKDSGSNTAQNDWKLPAVIVGVALSVVISVLVATLVYRKRHHQTPAFRNLQEPELPRDKPPYTISGHGMKPSSNYAFQQNQLTFNAE